jgi:DNA uptake protein ComE-like DNA-binding protein
MTKRAQEQTGSARDQWVPSDIDTTGAEDITPKPPSRSGDTDEWLAIPRPPRALGAAGSGVVNGNGHAPEDEPEHEPKAESPKRRGLPKRGTARERWLLTRLRRAGLRVEEQEEEIDRLKHEIKKLRASGPKTTPDPTPSGRQRSRAGKIDLHKASFEDLRDIGLSVTQSARLIAYRDARPDFDSVDELESIPGFAGATIGKLRQRAMVGSP